MEVKNGIIIDGVLHEAVNYPNDCECIRCSLRKQCDELENGMVEKNTYMKNCI